MGLLKSLKSPNIVRLHTCFLEESVLWVVMEWVDGGDLSGEQILAQDISITMRPLPSFRSDSPQRRPQIPHNGILHYARRLHTLWCEGRALYRVRRIFRVLDQNKGKGHDESVCAERLFCRFSCCYVIVLFMCEN